MTSYNQKMNTDCELMIQTIDKPDPKECTDTTINDLPVELLSLIFGHFTSFKDLSNFRLVSKLWKYCVENVKITQLIILSTSLPNQIESTWHHRLDFDTFDEKIYIKDISSLFECPFRLANVRRVYVCFAIRSKQDFEILKLFPKINHLELEFLENEKEYTLDSVELKKLHISDVMNGRLTVNSRIESLSCFNINNVNCVYPLDVKLLQLLNGHTITTVLCDSLVLKNLVERNMLSELPNLKIIVCLCFCSASSNGWKPYIDQLIAQRSQKGKKNTLKILYQDIELNYKVDWTYFIHRFDSI